MTTYDVVSAVFGLLLTALWVLALKMYQGVVRRMDLLEGREEKLETRMETLDRTVNANLEKSIAEIGRVGLGVERIKLEIVDRIHQLEIKVFNQLFQDRK